MKKTVMSFGSALLSFSSTFSSLDTHELLRHSYRSESILAVAICANLLNPATGDRGSPYHHLDLSD